LWHKKCNNENKEHFSPFVVVCNGVHSGILWKRQQVKGLRLPQLEQTLIHEVVKTIAMKHLNRDLLVCSKASAQDAAAYELEAEQLHPILCTIESAQQFARAHELLDLNRFKVIQKSHLVLQAHRDLQPFQFICNKN
jgi:hypothetical protein